MNRLSWLPFLVTPVLISACASQDCARAERSQDACLDQAENQGVSVDAYRSYAYECDTYDSIIFADPIIGGLLVPDFACMADVWDSADCLTLEGVTDALSADSACAF